MKRNLNGKSFSVDECFIDKKKKCICVPVLYLNKADKNWIDIDIACEAIEEIPKSEKFSEVKLTGQWDTEKSVKAGYKNYLLFYEEK